MPGRRLSVERTHAASKRKGPNPTCEWNDEIVHVKWVKALLPEGARGFVELIGGEALEVQAPASRHSGGLTMLRTSVFAKTMQEAGSALLGRALDPRRWMLPGRRVTKDNICEVGAVQVCATVDITPTLETFLRVSFRGPELSPMEAAELLEEFTATRFPFVPNTEWFVEIDARKWIHFSRRYTQPHLLA